MLSIFSINKTAAAVADQYRLKQNQDATKKAYKKIFQKSEEDEEDWEETVAEHAK